MSPPGTMRSPHRWPLATLTCRIVAQRLAVGTVPKLPIGHVEKRAMSSPRSSDYAALIGTALARQSRKCVCVHGDHAVFIACVQPLHIRRIAARAQRHEQRASGGPRSDGCAAHGAPACEFAAGCRKVGYRHHIIANCATIGL